MPSIVDIEGRLGLDTSEFDSGMASADASLSKTSALAGETGENLQESGAAIGAMGAGITAAFGLAASSALDFEANMANVNSILQLSATDLEALGTQVSGLSSATGKGPVELSEALYDIASSGFTGAEGLQVVEAAANAANAGLTSTATSGRAISAVLNAYGMEASEATTVSDVLFQTVNQGVLSFEELANNMGSTIPLASSMGVSIQEVGAAYAQMTLQGINASAAETQVAAVMKTAISPTKDLAAAITAAGYESGAAMIEAEGLAGFIQFLGETSGGSQEELFKLVGSSEALNAAMILGANGTDDFRASIAGMDAASEGAGATQEALAKQAESTQFSMNRLSAATEAARVAVGKGIVEAMKPAIDALASLAFKFADLDPSIQRVVGLVGIASGALITLTGGAMIAIPQIAKFKLAMDQLGVASKVAGLAFGPLGIAIAIAAAAFIAYQTNFLGFGDAVDAVVGHIQTFINYIRLAWEEGDQLNDFLSNLPGIVQPIALAIGTAVAAVREFTDAFIPLFQGFQERGFDPVVSALAALNTLFPQLNGALEVAHDVWINLKETVAAVAQALQQAFQALMAGDIGGFFGKLGEAAQAALGGLVEYLKIVGPAILQAFQAVDWGAVGGALAQGLLSLGTWVLQGLGQFGAWVLQALADLTVWFVNAFSQIDWGAVGGALASGLGTLASWVAQGLVGLSQWVLSAFGLIDWGAVGSTVATALQGFSTWVMQGLANLSQWFFDAFNQVDWGAIQSALGSAVQAAVEALGPIVGAALEAVRSAVMEAWGAITAATGPAWEAVKGAVETAWSAIQSAVESALSTVQSTVESAWSAIQDAVSTAVSTIQTTVETTWEAIKAAVSVAMSTIQSTIETVWSTIETTVSTVVETIQTAVSTAWTELQTSTETIWNAISSSIGTIIETIKTEVTEGAIVAKIAFVNEMGKLKDEALGKLGEMKDAILQFFADAGTWLLEAGKSVGQGLIDGLGSMKDAVGDAAGDLASSAVDNAKGLLRISSPSGVFREEVGQEVGAGMALGIEDSETDVAEAMSALIDKIKVTLRSALRDIRAVAGEALASFWDQRITETPEFFESIPAMTQMAVNAAIGHIDKLKAHAAGTRLQIQWLEDKRLGELTEGTAEYAATLQQIAALRSAASGQDMAVTAATFSQTRREIEQLQRRRRRTDNPAEQAKIKADIVLKQRTLGVLDQLAAAQNEYAMASSDVGREIAQVKIDAVTAQLHELNEFDTAGLFQPVIDEFQTLIDDMVAAVEEASTGESTRAIPPDEAARGTRSRDDEELDSRARSRERERGRGDTNYHIKKIEVRDDRDLIRNMRERQRQAERARSRGK